jgi:uroporphyrinogen-III synthase
MGKPINILSTKILSEIQKQELLKANFNVIEANFIETQNINFDLKNIHDHLIFTSQNAVYSVLTHPKVASLKSATVFCVGLKTKILLSENGFNVDVYTGYAEDLAEIITLIHSTDSFTFFSGNLRRETLPNTLKEAGINFNEVKVYETLLTPQKVTSPNLSKAEEQNFDGILFFSPSGVESYLKDNAIKKETCFCIGETTANALHKITKNTIIAENPSVEAVIASCIEEYL